MAYNQNQWQQQQYGFGKFHFGVARYSSRTGGLIIDYCESCHIGGPQAGPGYPTQGGPGYPPQGGPGYPAGGPGYPQGPGYGQPGQGGFQYNAPQPGFQIPGQGQPYEEPKSDDGRGFANDISGFEFNDKTIRAAFIR